MGKHDNWIDTGKVGDSVFAKHKFRCGKCGFEIESRHVPRFICPVCEKEMREKFDRIQAKFNE